MKAADAGTGDGAASRRLTGSVAVGALLASMILSACSTSSGAESPPSPDAPPSMSTIAEILALPRIKPTNPPPQPANNGFETATSGTCPAGWICAPLGKVETTVGRTKGSEGKHALQVGIPRSGDRVALRSKRLGVQPDRVYTARFHRKTSSVGPGGSMGVDSVRLRFFDKRGKLLGTRWQRERQAKKNDWNGVSLSMVAPPQTTHAEVELQLRGEARTAWVDSVKLSSRPIVRLWGGTGLRRGKTTDSLAIQLATPTGSGVHLRSIRLPEQALYVVSHKEMLGSDGTRYTYEMSGPMTYDTSRKLLVVKPGGPATLQITGARFKVTPGTGFQSAELVDPVGDTSFPIRIATRNVRSEPVLLRLPTRYGIEEAMRKLAAYLDTRRTKTGWAVAHSAWPGQLREDPQAIGVLTQGYLDAFEATGSAKFDRDARRGLGWLLANQKQDGSFGLPWPYGRDTTHFEYAGHYKDRHTHKAGQTLAVVTLSAGVALLNGYRTYDDKRYLDAANRVMDYLLRGKNGFQWLDAKKTRGSVPYCDLEPVFPPDSPQVKRHNDVLPRLRNTSVEVYNIDGAMLSFIRDVYKVTTDKSLLRYGDAIATNLMKRLNPDGSMPYSWYNPDPHSANYAALAYRGLLDYGELRKNDSWLDGASRGFSWVANQRPQVPASLPTETYASAYGLDLSVDTARYVQDTLDKQRKDGSLSGGKKTRQDTLVFSILARMLTDMNG